MKTDDTKKTRPINKNATQSYLSGGLLEAKVIELGDSILKYRTLEPDESWMDYHFVILFLTGLYINSFMEGDSSQVWVVLSTDYEDVVLRFTIDEPMKTLGQVGHWATINAELAVGGTLSQLRRHGSSKSELKSTTVLICRTRTAQPITIDKKLGAEIVVECLMDNTHDSFHK